MGWDGIGDLIGTISKWWTPEKVKARARQALIKLKEEENDLLFQAKTDRVIARLLVIRRNIKRLQDRLTND